MTHKSWHLDRRTFLRGTGVSLALPWLECMARAGEPASSESSRPKRMCAMYFGFGVGLPAEDSDVAAWRWFPKGEGRNYQFTEVLKPLEKHRSKLSVLAGLSHPNGRRMGGHDTADTFLTGSYLNNEFLTNTVSLDQVVAQSISDQTRFSSLVMSTDGGVGEPTRSSTLSLQRERSSDPCAPSTATDLRSFLWCRRSRYVSRETENSTAPRGCWIEYLKILIRSRIDWDRKTARSLTSISPQCVRSNKVSSDHSDGWRFHDLNCAMKNATCCIWMPMTKRRCCSFVRCTT